MSGKPYSVTLTQAQVMALALESFKDSYHQSRLAYILRRILFFVRSWFFDLEYNTMPAAMLSEKLEKWREEVLPSLKYMGETFDCDDFARYFAVWLKQEVAQELPVFNGSGLGIGLLYKDEELLGGHAWDIVLVTYPEGTPALVFVEPQLGEIVYSTAVPKGATSSDGYDYELLAVII